MIDVIVITKENLTDSVCRLVLVAKNGERLPAFDPGAHIDIYLNERSLIRQYSLCSSPLVSYYEIAVLKEPKSRGGSQFIHESVQVGDCLQISPPKNLFPMDPTAQKNLLFAAGIGITPILTMAENLSMQQQLFELYYCARSEDEAIYLQRIRQSLPESSVHLHLTNGVAGKRLVADNLLVNPDHGTHVYVCGPQSFIKGIMDSARRANWPEENLHQEYFSVTAQGDSAYEDNVYEDNVYGNNVYGNNADEENRENVCFEIEIHSTGQILTVPEDQSVFNVLEAHDIFIPVACEEGICGTCLTGVLAGEVEHRDLFLTEAEKKRMNQFTPCCSRARSKKLVLDL